MQMGVSRVALLDRRWMKRRAAEKITLSYLRPVTSMEVDSPPDIVLLGVEKQGSCPSIQNFLSGTSLGMTHAALCNYIYRKQNWVVRLWNPVMVYSQDHR